MTAGSQNRKGIVLGLALTIGLPGVLSSASAGDVSARVDLFLGMTPDAKKGYEALMTMPMGNPVMKTTDIGRLW